MNPAGFPAGVVTGAHPGWPARLGPLETRIGRVAGRPLRRSDWADWQRARIAGRGADRPLGRDQRPDLGAAAFPAPCGIRTGRCCGRARGAARWCRSRSPSRARFAGQVTLGGIQRGALRSGWVGYWVDSRFHGRGVATAAVALIVAHGFGPVGLHRIEATIAPENLASPGRWSRTWVSGRRVTWSGTWTSTAPGGTTCCTR